MPSLASQAYLVPKVTVLGCLVLAALIPINSSMCSALGVKKSRHYTSIIQFAIISAINLVLFYGEDWWFGDFAKCFEEARLLESELAVYRAVHIMYGVHLASDLVQLGKNVLSLTIAQTPVVILLVHDVVTITLVTVSWVSNYPCFGVVVMFIHDFTDLTFHFALVVFETGSEHWSTWLAYLLAVQQWVFFRIYTLSTAVYSIYTIWQHYKHMPEEEWKLDFPRAHDLDPLWIQRMTGAQVQVLIGFLGVLVCMHTIWLVQIIHKIAFDDEKKPRSPKNKAKQNAKAKRA